MNLGSARTIRREYSGTVLLAEDPLVNNRVVEILGVLFGLD